MSDKCPHHVRRNPACPVCARISDDLTSSLAAPAGSRERPILFSAPMVRAILDGRKTQTRRIVKPQPACLSGPNFDGLWSDSIPPVVRYFGCPYGAPGDRLWVRETFRTLYDPATCLEGALTIDYRADGVKRIGDEKLNGSIEREFKWAPSIYMRRFQSRITLEVVAVRVERLQSISEEDAQKEGVSRHHKRTDLWQAYNCTDGVCTTAIKSFETLWVEINGEDALDFNPWVWVITFKTVNPA